MTIDETAARLGALVAAERRLFEVLGGWVTTTPEPDAKVVFARLSRYHGEHAVTLAGLLPDTRDHDPDSLVALIDDDPLAAVLGAESTAERIAAVTGDVAAAHLGRIEAHLADCSTVRDAPAMRALVAILAEDRAGFEELSALGHR